MRARPRGGRLPRQQQPDHIRVAYFNAMRPIVDGAHAAVAGIAPEIVRALEDLRRRQRKHDVVKGPPPSTPEGDHARALVDRAAKRFTEGLRPTALHQVALQFGKATSDFQRAQLDQQVRHAIGVPLSAIERPTQDRIHLFASSNVELIKTVPDRYFDRVIRDVTTAFASGTHPDTLARKIADDYQIGLNDAMRIARDQVGKLAAQVNADRQQAIGCTSFTWRTAGDNRVRDSHRKLEGQQFEWDDLPIDEDTGETIAPGDAIQCRCYADPIFPSV